MIDLRKILLILAAFLLTLCLVGCITEAPPVAGENDTVQTEKATEQVTEAVPNTQVTEPASEQTAETTETTTEQSTEQITEEETTYGELHFPESGE